MQKLLVLPFEDLMKGQPHAAHLVFSKEAKDSLLTAVSGFKRKIGSNNNNNGHSVASITYFLQQSECK